MLPLKIHNAAANFNYASSRVGPVSPLPYIRLRNLSLSPLIIQCFCGVGVCDATRMHRSRDKPTWNSISQLWTRNASCTRSQPPMAPSAGCASGCAPSRCRRFCSLSPCVICFAVLEEDPPLPLWICVHPDVRYLISSPEFLPNCTEHRTTHICIEALVDPIRCDGRDPPPTVGI